MPGTVVTVGNFDGVHLGHQEIVRITIDQARADGLEAVAFTFRPHPQSVLRPDRAPELLLTYEEKLQKLVTLGLSRVVEQKFDLIFSSTTPEQFFQNQLLGHLAARAIVVGYDFTFGKERSGHLQVLQSLCDEAGVRLTVVAPRRLDQEVVSSSSIRSALRQGLVADAAKWMGAPFFYAGPVLRGDQRGRSLGFPTANLELGSKLVLPPGVYATVSEVEGARFASITNVGVRPTFKSASAGILAETHLLQGSWAPDALYGKNLRVEFFERIREERKFASPEELTSQIAEDIGRARQILGGVLNPFC
ncbi:MAG: riboflavin biosynthesis protein RibF [Oligoflexia bacterium]